MKRVVLVALFMAVALPAGAADQNRGHNILGVGINSCGIWQEDRKKDGLGSRVHENWVVGYISGYNAWVDGKADISEGTDVPGLLAWIDNYCAQNPLDKIATAANALINHLRSR